LFRRAGYTGDYYWTVLEADADLTRNAQAGPSRSTGQESR
jgi:hypothetical protein